MSTFNKHIQKQFGPSACIWKW